MIIGPSRRLRNPALGPSPGPPGRGRPRGAGREISGPGPGRPGGARGRPGSPPPGPPRTPQNGPFLGPIYTIFVLETPLLGGARWGALLGSPGAGPPGGEKSAHFFGYLITLPVGTVWGHFSDPPFWAILGGYPGTPAEGSVYRTHWTHPVGHSWAGPLGRRASDGYPLGGLSPNGWYVPSGRGPPSRQGRKSAQDREVAGRRRPFARAKRGPTTGVTGKVRKCLAEHIRPCQFQAGATPMLSVRTSAIGHGRPQAGRGTHRRRRLTHPHLSLLAPTHNSQQLLKKAKILHFWADLVLRLAETARDGPGGPGGSRRARGSGRLR